MHKFIRNVKCAIILFDHKVIVSQRIEKVKLPLKWQSHGSRLEEDENEEDGIIREIREERNIEIQNVEN